MLLYFIFSVNWYIRIVTYGMIVSYRTVCYVLYGYHTVIQYGSTSATSRYQYQVIIYTYEVIYILPGMILMRYDYR